MITREFSEEEVEELDLPWFNRVAVESLDEHRWYTVKRGVFFIDGKHYAIEWMDPATECQEGQDMWDSFPVIGYEVEEREVTLTRWLPKED